MQFSRHEEVILITLARKASESYILNGRSSIDDSPYASENLRICTGAFVSAYIDGSLRGCIGTFSEDEQIYKTVQKMAISAVSNDLRFRPVSENELGKLDLEISILSPRRVIRDISEIEIGKHGIYMTKGASRGTFLPQVAIDQNWTTEEFLSNCSKYKAGLGWDGWKSAELSVYETYIIFSK